VTLDGSGSSDADGDALDFDWAFVSAPPGSTASLSDPTAVKPTFVIDVTGDYVLQLVVNDGLEDSAPDTVTVSTENSPPMADAGPDQDAEVGDRVQLSGAGSTDADNDPLSFFWSLSSVPVGSATALSDPFAVEPTFVLDLAGEYVAQLIVNDGLVDSAPDTVMITANNRPPVADAGSDLVVDVGDTVTLDGSGSSDPEGDRLSFLWQLSTPAGSSAALSDVTAVRPTFVADVAGPYQVTLVVNDGLADSAPDGALVTALAATVTARDDTASTASDQPVDIAVLNNDLPSGAVTVDPASLVQPANGTVTLNADGTIRYAQSGLTEPRGMQLYKDSCSGCHSVQGFTGTDSFSYAATNGSNSDSAIVTVSVNTFDATSTRGDISGMTPTCILLGAIRQHIDCSGFGLGDSDMAEIAQFLQQVFP
jgi:mono/diheme cytochrome c family protein